MLTALLLAGLLSGCTERVPPPDERPERYPANAWEDLIGRATRSGGVDWALIAAEREALDDFLGWIAEHGPETRRIPEGFEEQRLALLLNAHNAVMVDAVLRFAWRDDVAPDLLRAPGDEVLRLRSFRVDGEWITLARLARDRVLAMFQSAIVHAALYRATRGGPRLRFYRAEGVRAHLELAMTEWINSDHGVRAQGGRWAVNRYLMENADDFRDWGRAPTLCAALVDHANGEREAWLTEHIGDCPLGTFPEDERLDIPD